MFNKFSISLALSALIFVGCGGGSSNSSSNSSTTPSNATRAVSVNFEALVNGDNFSCEKSYENIGVTKVSGGFKDFRLYVSEVKLIDKSGEAVAVELTQDGAWQFDSVALLDFENASGSCVDRANTAETNTKVSGTVLDREYVAVSFTLGVPKTLNHTNIDETPAPLNSSAMNWNWQGGRKFTKMEFAPSEAITKTDGTTSPIWNFHLGSTGCEGDVVENKVECAQPNRVYVKLDSFDVDSQKISVDFGSLVKDSYLNEDKGGASGCMSGQSDPECSSIFANLDLTLGVCEDGCEKQTLFSVK